MKKLISATIAVIVLFSASYSGFSQESEQKELQEITSYKLEISSSKTSNIIFPYAIISVDRGSKDILAQKAMGVENILQVKAASEDFTESNLSVVTADGKLTTFIVNYSQNPASLNVSLDPRNENPEKSVFIPKDNVNEAVLRQDVQYVLDTKRYRPGLKGEKNDIALYLKGIFIKDEVLYFRFTITNWSNVGYNIDQFRFFIRDQRKAKRTATQEIEVVPIYVHKSPEKIEGKTVDTHVFALPKFTIPDKKYLAVQLMEKDGGRHVDIKVKNRHILSALVLK